MNFFVMKLAIMVILIVVPCRGNPIAKETAKSLPTNALEHSSGQIELPDRPNTKIFWSDKVMQSHITKYLQVMLKTLEFEDTMSKLFCNIIIDHGLCNKLKSPYEYPTKCKKTCGCCELGWKDYSGKY